MIYYKLNVVSTISNLLLNYALQSNNWNYKNSFNYINVPFDIIKSETILKYFYVTFKANPVILVSKPYSFYKFHIDETRQCAINMLLNGFDSNCFFGEPTTSDDIIDNIKELVYEPNTYYIFNTKKKHAVMNRSSIRYMFSMGINLFDYNYVLNKFKLNQNFNYLIK